MAENQELINLRDGVKKTLNYFDKNLVDRADWGALNFENAKPHYTQIKQIFGYLDQLPLEFLTASAIKKIQESIDSILPILKSINEFDVETQTAGDRDALILFILAQLDPLYDSAGHCIPFLAYQKGDIIENINKLSKAVRDADQILEEAKTGLKESKGEMDKIISAAREASASAGAAVFTGDFERESGSLNVGSYVWLFGAIAFFIASICFSYFIIWCQAGDVNFNAELGKYIQIFAVKLFILSSLISVSVWCSGQYKTLKHLSTLNHHRSLSLKTLQAFVASASEAQVKDAVLMEACRTVFQSGQTGYLDSKKMQSHPSMQIMEIAKNYKKEA